MNTPVPPLDAQGTSTRPYLIRALHDWCTDNGFTPYLAVYVDEHVQVPMEYVKNREIVLNVGFEATSGLKLGNEFIEFKARFGGAARDIVVPVDHVVAIYARENGQGMAFPVPTEPGATASGGSSTAGAATGTGAGAGPEGRPAAPSRGLRLASSEAPEGAEASSDPRHDPDLPDGDDPADPPPAGAGRPALKRIK